MLRRTRIIILPLIALTVSVVVVKPSKRPPARVFRNLVEYWSAVYDNTPGSWAGTKDVWETEIVGVNNGIVGGTVPETPAITRFYEESPQTANNLDGIVTLFGWYLDKKPSPASLRALFQGYTGSTATPEWIFCNQHVLIFRTLLAKRGFTSRPVIFDFTDGPGSASHTFLEVWDPQARKWLWFDPLYEAYSRTLGTGELITGDRGLAPQIAVWYPETSETEAERAKQIDNRRGAVIEQFWGKQPSDCGAREPGWALWYIENGKTGERIEYHDPKYYKE